MLSYVRRSVLLASGVAALALASSPAFAQTQSGFDTITGVHNLPIAVGGVAIMTLSDNTPSNTVAVNGKLQLSGWLGIGTSNPITPLDVRGNTLEPGFYNQSVLASFQGGTTESDGWSRARLIVEGATNYTNSEINLRSNDPSGTLRGAHIAYVPPGGENGTNGGLNFSLYPYSGVSMVIDATNGNVGIGTTAPAAMLDVKGTVAIGTQTNGTIFSPFTVSGDSGDLIVTGGSDSRWAIYHAAPSTSGSPREAMAIEANGVVDFLNNSVGIGIASPIRALHVVGEVSITPNSLNGLSGFMNISDVNGNGGSNYAYVLRGLDAAGTTTVNLNAFHIYANTSYFAGNVGIGNANPSYTLDVTGQARFTGNYTTSDRRLKTNITDIGYGLGDVMKLRPVFFDWKNPVKGEEGRRVGFIAQDIEQVIPEIVSTASDEMKTKAVEYGNITPVLVKAIQEQQAQIATIPELKSEIAALHADIEQLKAAQKITHQ